MADEAHEVGNPRVTDSYLKIDKILEIARLSKQMRFTPDTAFSENAEFARRCEEAGIVFIGPSADVISRMGSKIESRNSMEKAGVPVVPGIAYPLADAEEAAQEAHRIGYRSCSRLRPAVAGSACRSLITNRK